MKQGNFILAGTDTLIVLIILAHAHARSANTAYTIYMHVCSHMALIPVADTSILCLGHQRLEYSHHADHLLAGTPLCVSK
ncbi:hypothetical protein BDR07DRAFT_795759 [Suillus spraguei]|nr:hypothetical protein BDR07DRAFT_795759 [Suillus spraguei]